MNFLATRRPSPMAIPKVKPGEPKKKRTLWGRMKNSALFLLLVIIGFTGLVVYLIVGISQLLSEGKWPGF